MIKHFFERILFAYGRAIYRFRYYALLVVALLTVASLYWVSQIRIDSNLSALLPQNNPIVQNINQVSDVYGGLGYLVVLVRGESGDDAVEFMKEVVPRVREHEEVRYVEYRKPYGYFKKHMLLYADLDDLKKLYYRLYRKFEYERKKNNPLLIDFGTEKDPGLYYEDLVKKYKNEYSFIKPQLKNPYSEYLHKFNKKKKQHTFLMLIKPAQSALGVGYAQLFLDEMQKIINAAGPEQASLTIDYGGRFKKSPDDFYLLGQDFKRITMVAGIGILLILILFFRSFWPVVVIFLPLVVGILWTLGFVGFSFGQLNLITSFLVAILLGLGIDYGIHLIVRFEEEKKFRESFRENFLIMMSQTGAANLASSLTTALAFYALSFTEFRAFSEFGIIAGTGILFLFFNMVTLLPALLIIIEEKFSITLHKNSWMMPARFWRFPVATLIIALVVTGFSLTKLDDVRFDYDFSKIQAKDMLSHKLDPEINKILDRAQNPTVILPKNIKQERKLIEAIRRDIREHQDEKDYMLDKAFGISMFIPENQQKKYAYLQKIRNLLVANSKYRKTLSPKHRREWNRLWLKVNVNKVTKERLPATLQRTFHGIGKHKDQSIILLFPEPNMTLGLDWLHFAENLGEIEYNGEKIKAASDELIFAEILKMMKREGPYILTFAFLAVLIVVSVNFTSLAEGVLMIAPLVAGMTWILGLMSILGLPVDFFNIIMFPIIVGIGIDSSIHIYHRYKESGDMLFAVRHTVVPVFLSSVTSMVGFGALMVASNDGMKSTGKVAVIGIFLTFLVSAFVLASIVFSYRKWRGRAKAQGGNS